MDEILFDIVTDFIEQLGNEKDTEGQIEKVKKDSPLKPITSASESARDFKNQKGNIISISASGVKSHPVETEEQKAIYTPTKLKATSNIQKEAKPNEDYIPINKAIGVGKTICASGVKNRDVKLTDEQYSASTLKPEPKPIAKEEIVDTVEAKTEVSAEGVKINTNSASTMEAMEPIKEEIKPLIDGIEPIIPIIEVPNNPNEATPSDEDLKNTYDERGFNGLGYHRNGTRRDNEGYDIEGYSVFGYDKDGYDKEGYNRLGYNKEGYDNEGYDKNGYNKDGINRFGLNRNY